MVILRMHKIFWQRLTLTNRFDIHNAQGKHEHTEKQEEEKRQTEHCLGFL
jgi:hypothetical protein